MNRYYRSQLCKKSTTYDLEHWESEGRACKFKHTYYHWEGVYDNQILMISDSLMKWIRDVGHLEVKAFPGINLAVALGKMTSGEVSCTGYTGIIISLGCNDIPRRDSTDITIIADIRKIVKFIREGFPGTRVAITMIIPRPGDNSAVNEDKRVKVNSWIRQLCRREHITFMNTFRAVALSLPPGVKSDPANQIPDLAKYAYDRIHLNRSGIVSMRRFLIGATASFVGYKPRNKAKNT